MEQEEQKEPGQDDEIITIGTLINQREIAFVKSVFEDREIWCFVTDELTTTIVPHYSLAMGEARLQVRRSDAEEAVKLLKEIRENDEKSTDEVWEDDPEELEHFMEDKEDLKAKAKINKIVFWVIILILGLTIFYRLNL